MKATKVRRQMARVSFKMGIEFAGLAHIGYLTENHNSKWV